MTSFSESLINVDDDGENDAEAMERIRIYQVNRLKYFYAVAEFNTVEAADKVSILKYFEPFWQN
jgi:hypothetical protein